MQVVGSRVAEFYAELGVEVKGQGREAMVSCFANPDAHKHGDRNKSCSVNLLTGLWKCHGCGEQGNAYVAALSCGLQERDAADLAKRHGLFIEREQQNFTMGGWRQWKKWIADLEAKPKLIARLGELKGWTPDAIRSLGLGWNGKRITFLHTRPVGVDQKPKIVGVMGYLPGGDPKVWAMPGSERTLFPRPERLAKDAPLFIVEGEPDAVSVRSCGHNATSIPGDQSWKPEWAYRLTRFENMILLPDCDPQGRDVMGRIRTVLPKARMLDLAPDRHDGYDIGDLVAEASREGGLAQVKRLLDAVAA
jgi:hypothetical protein